MDDKPFYCEVVGGNVTAGVCEARVKQGKELRAKGDPHASLNKCILCATTSTPAGMEKCPECGKPKVHKKLRWNKKHGMHVNCYYRLTKGGKAPDPKPVKAVHPAGTITELPPEPLITTLSERGKVYGGYPEQCRITQNIKRAMMDSPNWASLSDDKKEALEMIALKSGRILNGDPEHVDSWHDIAGYAKLVEDSLNG